MADETNLHIALFPWLAFGHILPFFELSKSLAQRGHRISFISTPRNLQRLPVIGSSLSSLLNLVPISFPPQSNTTNLPPQAESMNDITTPDQGQALLESFDTLEDPITRFLEESHPDWIIYDFASHWLPPIAAKLDIPCAYFNIFNACMVAFYGSVTEMTREDRRSRLNPEDFMVPPKWVPFPSNLALRPHEAPATDALKQPKRRVYRLGKSIEGCKFMAVRSCTEFEGEWLRLLQDELYQKPVVPVGLLPPPKDGGEKDEEKWVAIKEWLDKQKEGSVVYIAFGTESALSQNQVIELARGLELSGLAFFWVLRNPLGSLSVLPTGFEERVKDRGYVTVAWVPQLSILAHRSVGGFLTHSGWSSIIEGLGYGLALILLPLSPPQGLNARVLEWKKIGLEIPRDERDGSFSRDSVAESLRVVMVENKGEGFRTKAKEMMEVFGNKEQHDLYIYKFDKYLRECRYRS